MSTKNLGFVKAIHRGLTAPTNTEMLWYNLGDNFHYYYDVAESIWKKLISDNYVESGSLSCQISEIPNDTVVYVIYDTTSLSGAAVTHLSDIVAQWFANYQAANPGWGGTLKEYEIPAGDAKMEQWLLWAGIPYTERLDASYTGNVVVICFIDEADNTGAYPDYIYHEHNSPVDLANQPTTAFTSAYNSFINTWLPSYKSFSGFVYAVPSVAIGSLSAEQQISVSNFELHIQAAIQGRNMVISEITVPYLVDTVLGESTEYISALATNPYSSLPTKLINCGWSFENNFSVGAEEITLNDFSTTINNFLSNKFRFALKVTLQMADGGQVEIEGDISNCLQTQQAATTSSLAIQQITDPVYLVTAEDIANGYADVPTRYKLAPYFHVFAWLNNIPLTVSKINGILIGNTDQGSVEYTENTSVVRINFLNNNDFGGEESYLPEVGWPIMLKYTKITQVIIPPVTSNVTITSVTGTVTSSNVTYFDIVLANSGANENIEATLTLTNSAGTVIDSYVSQHNVNDGYTFRSSNYPNLTADDYTMTCILNNGEIDDDMVTIPDLEPIFTPIELNAIRLSSTEIQVTQTIKNTGSASGDFAVCFALDAGAKTALIWKTIAIGATESFVHTFTGTNTSSHDVYSYTDNTYFTYTAPSYYTV